VWYSVACAYACCNCAADWCAPKATRNASGLRSTSRAGGSPSQRTNARLPAGVIEYGWLDRAPGLPSLTNPASASAGSSRYTWLRVIDQ
jgi:hypothetical protein